LKFGSLATCGKNSVEFCSVTRQDGVRRKKEHWQNIMAYA